MVAVAEVKAKVCSLLPTVPVPTPARSVFSNARKGAAGANQAISWVIALFIIGILVGAAVYTLTEFQGAIGNTSAATYISEILDVYGILPTWIKILVIMGFSTVIALLGLEIYRRLNERSVGL